MPDRMSEYMSDSMPNRMPEYIADRLQEYIYLSIYYIDKSISKCQID